MNRKSKITIIILMFTLMFSSLAFAQLTPVTQQYSQTRSVKPQTYNPLYRSLTTIPEQVFGNGAPTYTYGTSTTNDYTYTMVQDNSYHVSTSSSYQTGGNYADLATGAPTFTYGTSTSGTYLDTQTSNDVWHQCTTSSYSSGGTADKLATGAPTYTYGTSTSGSYTDTQSSNDVYHQSTTSSYSTSSGSSTKGTTTWTNYASGGSISWTNPTNAQSSNDVWTYSSAGASAKYTNTLGGSSFGFGVPAGSTIDGFIVLHEKHASLNDPSDGSYVQDNLVYLTKVAGTATGNNKASGSYWAESDTNWNYGTSSDLWGTTWSVVEVNDNGFGTILKAYVHGATHYANTAYVDYISITVYYHTDSYRIDYYYAFQFTEGARADVTGLVMYAEGKTSGDTVKIYIYNWAGSWFDTSQTWTTVEGTKSYDASASITTYMDASGNMRTRFAIDSLSASRIEYADYLYWHVTYNTTFYRIDYYYQFQFSEGSRADVTQLDWSAEGKTSGDTVKIYLYNFQTSAWDDTTKTWSSAESTQGATSISINYMSNDANQYMRIRFYVTGLSASRIVYADYLYFYVHALATFYRIDYYYPFQETNVTNTVTALGWTVNGKISTGTVGIYLWNYVGSSWDNTGQTLGTVQGTVSGAGNVANNIDANKNMKIRFFVDNVASSFTLSIDYMKWDVSVDPPSAPILIAPNNATLVTTLTPIVYWQRASSGINPCSYRVVVSTDKAFGSTVVNTTTTQTFYNITSVLTSATTYYWKVRAIDQMNNVGSWSATWQFVPVGSYTYTSFTLPYSAMQYASDGAHQWGGYNNPNYDANLNYITETNPNTLDWVQGGGNQKSYVLRGNYSFNIPLGSTILGIEVEVYKYSVWNTHVHDKVVQMVKNGTAVGNNYAVTGSSWSAGWNMAVYGGSTNLWGTTWTAGEINNLQFGVDFQINADATVAEADVDYECIKIYYIEAPSKVNLCYPLNSETVSYNPSLIWNATLSSGTSYYHLQVSNVSSFANPVINITTTNVWYRVTLILNVSEYYWRVRAINTANVVGVWSDIGNFFVGNYMLIVWENTPFNPSSFYQSSGLETFKFHVIVGNGSVLPTYMYSAQIALNGYNDLSSWSAVGNYYIRTLNSPVVMDIGNYSFVVVANMTGFSPTTSSRPFTVFIGHLSFDSLNVATSIYKPNSVVFSFKIKDELSNYFTSGLTFYNKVDTTGVTFTYNGSYWVYTLSSSAWSENYHTLFLNVTKTYYATDSTSRIFEVKMYHLSIGTWTGSANDYYPSDYFANFTVSDELGIFATSTVTFTFDTIPYGTLTNYGSGLYGIDIPTMYGTTRIIGEGNHTLIVSAVNSGMHNATYSFTFKLSYRTIGLLYVGSTLMNYQYKMENYTFRIDLGYVTGLTYGMTIDGASVTTYNYMNSGYLYVYATENLTDAVHAVTLSASAINMKDTSLTAYVTLISPDKLGLLVQSNPSGSSIDLAQTYQIWFYIVDSHGLHYTSGTVIVNIYDSVFHALIYTQALTANSLGLYNVTVKGTQLIFWATYNVYVYVVFNGYLRQEIRLSSFTITESILNIVNYSCMAIAWILGVPAVVSWVNNRRKKELAKIGVKYDILHETFDYSPNRFLPLFGAFVAITISSVYWLFALGNNILSWIGLGVGVISLVIGLLLFFASKNLYVIIGLGVADIALSIFNIYWAWTQWTMGTIMLGILSPVIISCFYLITACVLAMNNEKVDSKEVITKGSKIELTLKRGLR